MSNVGDKDTQSIVAEYELPKPPEKVWRALTEPALIAAWLMENDFEPVVGHAFTFRSQPMGGWDGTVQCVVLAVEPHKLLSYSWQGGSGAGRLDTVVTFTLTPTSSGGTRLRLEHAGFTPLNGFAFENMGKGWHRMVSERIDAALSKLA